MIKASVCVNNFILSLSHLFSLSLILPSFLLIFVSNRDTENQYKILQHFYYFLVFVYTIC